MPTKTPDRSPLPGRPDVAALTKDYAGGAATSGGEAFDATPENIEKHVVRSQVGSVKLAMLEKSTRGKEVHVALMLHYGTAADMKGRADAGDFVPDMLMRGTAKHTYQQIKDELDRLKAHLSISAGAGIIPLPGVVTVDITTDHDNLSAVMALLDELLKTSTFAADQFEIVKKESITQAQDQLNQPFAIALNAALRKSFDFPPDDIRYIPTIQENIERTKEVKVEDVKKFAQDFYGASNADLAIVGDFDPKAFQADVAKYLGDWKSPKPFERIDMPYTKVKAGQDIIDTPDKEGGLLIMIENIQMRDDDADYPGLTIANYVLGGGGASRVINRLRQKEGWSYGAGTQAQAMSVSKRGMVIGYALVAPQNAMKALGAFMEEIKKFVADGPTAEELEKAKTGYLQSFNTQLAQDEALTKILASYLFIDRTLDFDAKKNAAISKLTLADITKVLKKGYIDADGFAKIIVADQKKANAAPASAPAAPASAPAAPSTQPAQ